MEDTLASHEIEDVDVNDAAIRLVDAERELSAMEMLTIILHIGAKCPKKI